MATHESTTGTTPPWPPADTRVGPRFRIAPEVEALGVRGAFAIVDSLDNTVPSAALEPYREALRQRLRAELDGDFIARDPVLAGFRALHHRIGRSNRRFPASAESLVALFLRKGVVPAVNPLVDLYNGVSLETRLSLGAHDLAHVQGAIELRLTTGAEPFVPLGSTETEAVGPGEYAYIDSAGRILCRLEHRQCEATKVTTATQACFYILQGNPATDRGSLERGLERLITLTTTYCGGRVLDSWVVA